MSYIFDTFSEAGQFAAHFCATNKTTASVERVNGKWAVVPSNEFRDAQAHEAQEKRLAEARRSALAQQAAETVAQEKRARSLLEERQRYIGSLSKDALQALWDNRSRELTDSELELIRERLRKALNITSTEPPRISFCGSCLLQLDACKCRA